jgi:hypothetical protein
LRNAIVIIYSRGVLQSPGIRTFGNGLSQLSPLRPVLGNGDPLIEILRNALTFAPDDKGSDDEDPEDDSSNDEGDDEEPADNTTSFGFLKLLEVNIDTSEEALDELAGSKFAGSIVCLINQS